MPDELVAPNKVVDPSKLDFNSIKGTGTYGGASSDLKFSDFTFQPKTNADNYLLRAQGQGFGAQLGLTLANGAANLLTGMGEMIGFGGSLLTEWGKDDKDYSNALTEQMQAWHNPFGEVYRKRPNQMVDLSDSAWWLNTFGDLVVSAATFAIPGMGLGMAFSKATEAAALALDGVKAAKLGLTTSKLLNGARGVAEVATSATLAYAEGAQMGYQVYDKSFATQYAKGIKEGKSTEEATRNAREIASNAAATTVQLNTIMNTGLNMIQLMPFFHNADDAVKKFLRTEGRMAEGETAAAFRDRMKGFVGSDGAKKALAHEYRATSVLGELAIEGGSEGLEELNNNFAEKTGYAQGDRGAKSGMISQMKELSHWADRTMDAEGALSFALGAIGGMTQSVLIDRLPVHRIDKIGADGKPILKTTGGETPDLVQGKDGKYKAEKQWVTGITRKYNGQVERFNDIADSLANDANWFDTKQQELKAAVANNDYAKANAVRSEMMDVTNMNAVTLGQGKNVRAMYEQLGQVDNTVDVGAQLMDEITKKREEASKIEDPAEQQAAMEQLDAQEKDAQSKMGQSYAMINGLTNSMEDSNYKEQSRRALERIDAIQTAFDTAEKNYGLDNASDKATGVKDYVFRTTANQALMALNLKHATQDLEKARIEFNKTNPAHTSREVLDVANIEYKNKNNNLLAVHKTLIGDSEAINVLARRIQEGTASEDDTNKFRSLMQKYASTVTGSVVSDVKQTQRAIKQESDRVNSEMLENRDVMLASVGYTEWVAKNPGKTIEDYQEKLNETFAQNDHIDSLEKHIEESKTQLNILNDQVASMKKDKFTKLRKKLLDDIEKDRAEEERKNTENLKDAAANTLVARANAAIDNNQRDTTISQATKEIANLQGEVTILAKELAELRAFKWNPKSILDRFGDNTQAKMRDLMIRIATKRAQIDQWTAVKNELVTTPQTEPVIPDADSEPVVESPQEVQPEIPTEPTPLSEDEKLELVTKWFEDVSNRNIFLTPEEFGDILKGYVGDRMSAEEIHDTVIANLDNLNIVEKAPMDYWSNVRAFILNNFPVGQQAQMLEQLSNFLVSMENEHPKMPSDAQLVETMMQNAPSLNRDNVKHVANLSRALADSMQKEMMTYAELVLNQNLAYETSVANDIYDISPETPVMEPTPGPTPLPTEGDSSQPDEGSLDQNDAVNQQKDIHFGLKSLNANSVATTTLQYEEDRVPQSDGSNKHVFVNKRDANGNLLINPEVNTRILFPDYITSGDNLTLKVEPDNNTVLNADGSLSNTGMGTFNIAIYGPDGQKIGNVHTTTWTTASNIADASGDEQFRNIAGDAQAVQKAQTQLLDFRSFIANAYNKNKGQVEFHTKVTDKSPGMTNLHVIQDKPGAPKRVVPWLASKALPDNTLTIGLMLNGMVKTDWEVMKDATAIGLDVSTATKLNGYPIVMLPTANGGFTYGILERSRLADNEDSPLYQTAIRAMELYLGQNTDSEEVTQIKAATGHDVTTVQGLKAYFQEQITETTIINKLDLSGNGNGKYMLQIDSVGIAIGKHGGGKSAERVSMSNPVTDNFKAKLLELFKQRFSVVSIAHKGLGTRGLNSEGKFSRTTYNPQSGKWTMVPFDNYNAYVKSITTTIVDGTAKTQDGKYTYTANPRIDFDTMSITAKKAVDQPAVTPVTDPADDEQALRDMTGFNTFEDNLDAAPKLNALKPDDYAGTRVLNRATLESMFKSLPESERNGRSVDEVLNERVSLGHTFIVDGDNPFRQCS